MDLNHYISQPIPWYFLWGAWAWASLTGFFVVTKLFGSWRLGLAPVVMITFFSYMGLQIIPLYVFAVTYACVAGVLVWSLWRNPSTGENLEEMQPVWFMDHRDEAKGSGDR